MTLPHRAPHRKNLRNAPCSSHPPCPRLPSAYAMLVVLYIYFILFFTYVATHGYISSLPYEPIELSLARTIWLRYAALSAIYAVPNSSNHFHIPGDNFKREVCVDDLEWRPSRERHKPSSPLTFPSQLAGQLCPSQASSVAFCFAVSTITHHQSSPHDRC
jgi:hypothetical protein